MNSNAVALLLFVALAVCIGDSAEIPPLPVQDDQTAGASSAEPEESYLGVKLYKMERPCAMLGGMCVQTSECKQRPANSGLCPENTHLGVDCCYEGRLYRCFSSRTIAVAKIGFCVVIVLLIVLFLLSVSVKPASNLTCHEYRGACMERCAEELQRPSTDCTDGSKCCVLVA
ncbi:uncharacterized protein LOC4576735 isoform X1 [Anopheles gambiae]|uniref:uncharacterized protein LOC4576735 isoform X1 n=1 Tax=Anopheles gambiae TaxID=7165 RepID=UPI002AC90F03|nr:uncharacterized protein LOC4576735 isoform X1 [Anopheles gambiae]XP_061502017.1 uncharacterized protein LOC4576735 isoform X1 [Anopheles gambiae]XP_061502018.1 uncharacterized protein LOC4576735 isoform X1 [Anopheles gambiae]XP_061502019.1 uncharacterized protein LOC4576735 isoform X1 [Anopheles gambiae]